MSLIVQYDIPHGIVQRIPDPADTGTQLIVLFDNNIKLPSTPFGIAVYPSAVIPLAVSAEISRVILVQDTGVGTHILTIQRKSEGDVRRSIKTGDQVLCGVSYADLLAAEGFSIPNSNGYLHNNGEGKLTWELAFGEIFGEIRSANYVYHTTGYRMSPEGALDCRSIYADQMTVKVFVADLERAVNGSEIITPSRSPLAAPFTIPEPGATSTLVVEEFPGFTGSVFVSGHVIRVRQFSRSENTTLNVSDTWGTVGNATRIPTSKPPSQSYTFTRSSYPNAGAGVAGQIIPVGTLALDYGVSGNGYYEVTTVDGVNGVYSPYSQTVQWTTHPATGCVVKTRDGNLTGIYDTDFGGALTGWGFYGNNVYVKGKIVMTNQSSIAISGFNNDAEFLNAANSFANFYTATAPTVIDDGLKVGDLWYDTNIYRMKRCATISPTVTWDIVGGVVQTFSADTEPSGAVSGDFWFDTHIKTPTVKYIMRRRNATTGGTEATRWDVYSVYMDGAGIYAGEITAGQVTAGMFIGLTFQTAASGKRVVISSSTNDLKIYDADGVLCGGIWGVDGKIGITGGDLFQTSKYITGTTFTYQILGNNYIENLLRTISPSNYHRGIRIGNQYLEFGEGNYGIDYDVNLYRSGANILKTDDTFDAAAYLVGGSALSYGDVGAAAADHNHSGVYAPANQGGVWGSPGVSDAWVAASSGGAVTTRLSTITLIIGEDQYDLLIAP
jgi:hypothetical protein